MTGSTRSSRHRHPLGSVLAAGALGALLVTGVSACASTSKPVSVSAGSTATSPGPASASATASPSASPTTAAGGSATPSAPATGATSTGQATIPSGVVIPKAQSSEIPANTKFTAFQSAAHSADGRTLYLGIESQGGACGQYDVVLQQSSDSVSVGLVHLPSGGRICPLYVAHMVVKASLAAPLNGRRVIDLANGQTMQSAQIG